MWCQVRASHIHANHEKSLNYNNSKHPGKKSFINKYMRNPTDIKLCMSHTNCLFTRPHTQKTCRIQSASVLVTASYGHYGQRAARIGPDSICRIRLPVSVFSKEGMDHTVQNRPGSDLGGLVRVWPNTSVPEASRFAGIIGTGFWQEATGPLPVSDFQTRFHSSTDVPDTNVQNQPGSDLVLADCARF